MNKNIDIERELSVMTDVITEATRKSLLQLFENGEKFYYCSLITVGEGLVPTISAWSWEALKKECKKQNVPEDWLKWSYADSPYLDFGTENFNRVKALYSSRPTIDDSDENIWETEFNLRLKAMELSLKRLDNEGIFSRNQNREEICVLVEVMPPNKINTETALRLNDPKSKAMEEWLKQAE